MTKNLADVSALQGHALEMLCNFEINDNCLEHFF